MPGRRTLPAVVVLAALTACGADVSQDDDEEPQDATVRAGLVALYAVDTSDAAAPDAAREAECFADALLERVDLDELVRAGIVEDDGSVTAAIPMLDVDVAEAWVDAQASCVAYVVPSTRAALDQSEGTIDPRTYAACFQAAITDAEVHAALVASLSGGLDTPPVAALRDVQADCAEQARSRG